VLKQPSLFWGLEKLLVTGGIVLPSICTPRLFGRGDACVCPSFLLKTCVNLPVTGFFNSPITSGGFMEDDDNKSAFVIAYMIVALSAAAMGLFVGWLIWH